MRSLCFRSRFSHSFNLRPSYPNSSSQYFRLRPSCFFSTTKEKLETFKSIFPAVLSSKFKKDATIGLFEAREQKFKDLEELEKSYNNETEAMFLDILKEDYEKLKQELKEIEDEIMEKLLPKDSLDDSKTVVLEVRAGTGGSEAQIFALQVFEMYKNFAKNNRWKFDASYVTETDVEGCREAVAIVSGTKVYARLKFESGVHRVQRIPATETMGRLHTSTVTVAVLPEPQELDLKIDEKDLRIDVFRSSGAGGQHVNKTESAVRVTHIPTGVAVVSQDERSQHHNKARAMRIITAKVSDMQRQKVAAERAAERNSLIGTGGRSERIRTYNFSQDRVTDHRISFSVHNVNAVMEGENLDMLIDELDGRSREMMMQSFLKE